MISGRKCENCMFFEIGTCKRYPPNVFVPNYGTRQPYVNSDSWCGEFRQDPEMFANVVQPALLVENDNIKTGTFQ